MAERDRQMLAVVDGAGRLTLLGRPGDEAPLGKMAKRLNERYPARGEYRITPIVIRETAG